MKKLFAVVAIAFATLFASGCTIIDTGEVGLRKNFDKTIETTELREGSLNQTIIGDVLTFPVRDVNVSIDNLPAVLSKDNSTMKEVDFTIIYNINPSCVSDLYVKKSRSFHTVHDGDIYLMHSYISQVAGNSISQSIRQFDAMLANDNKPVIEADVVSRMVNRLKTDGLDGCILITSARAGALTPSDALKNAADALVRAKTEEKTKEVEVSIAKKEAERMAALAQNSGQSIAYMQAQANMKIAEAIAAGKVNTIIVPSDFKGMVNVGK